jgi:SAM-dependent methyltransferase
VLLLEVRRATALMTNLDPTQRVRAFYRQYAPRYDQQTAWYDRVLLGDGRAWAGAQSDGAVLEVAIGTGRNLPYYPRDRWLTGIDLTPAMLTLARDRARELHVAVALLVADAQALPFAAASFDSVVCTLGLNAIPDDRAAVAEMYRGLAARRPAGAAWPRRQPLPGRAGDAAGCCRWPAITRRASRCRCCGRPGSSSTARSSPGQASSSGWWRPSPTTGDLTATRPAPMRTSSAARSGRGRVA